MSESETAPETRIATPIVTANSWSRRPMMPPMKRTGRNTATRESVIETMVKAISREPSSAALSGGFPFSMCRTMFSSITIASSTTKPTDSVSAISERLSRLKPSSHMAAKVPTTESGSAAAGISVADTFRRNRKITRITRPMVSTQRELHVADRGADRLRAVEQHVELHGAGDLGADLRQERPDRVDDLDGVRAGLALDREHDRAVGAVPARHAVVLDAVDHAARRRRAGPVRRRDRR